MTLRTNNGSDEYFYFEPYIHDTSIVYTHEPADKIYYIIVGVDMITRNTSTVFDTMKMYKNCYY